MGNVWFDGDLQNYGIDTNLGKDAEVDEFLNNVKTFILHGINEANQIGFKAQREEAPLN